MASAYELFPSALYEAAITWRNQLDKRLKPLGLSQAKWRALLHLSLVKTPITQTELASKLGIETPTLAGLLDRLAEAGWVKRENSLGDRRSKTVHLTPKSQKTIDEIRAISNALRDELLAVVAEEDLQHCIQVLSKIKSQAENLA